MSKSNSIAVCITNFRGGRHIIVAADVVVVVVVVKLIHPCVQLEL